MKKLFSMLIISALSVALFTACIDVGYLVGDLDESSEHKHDWIMQYNENCHWAVCDCGAERYFGPHEFTHDNFCRSCEYCEYKERVGIAEESEISNAEESEISNEEISKTENFDASIVTDPISDITVSQDNDDVKNGVLAIIDNNYPEIADDELIIIYESKQGDYGLSTSRMLLREVAFTNIDQLLTDFCDTLPSSGIIIDKAYLSANKASSEKEKELTSGYSVMLGIFASNYLFSDKEFSYLYDHAWKYGIIQRYPSGKKSYTGEAEDMTLFRYVGPAHSEYMYRNDLCLEEYVALLREKGHVTFSSSLDDSTTYLIYYTEADADSDTTDITVFGGTNYEYSISGDGESGFIIAVSITE